jgi:polar amino acid transport system substrate-binding protein
MLKKLTITMMCVLFSATLVSAASVTVFGNSKIPPALYMESKTPKGFGVEITEAVLKEAGIGYSIKLAPWKRAYASAKAGKGIIIGLMHNEERAKIFDFSKPLWSEALVLVTKKGKELTLDSSSLKGKSIALQAGSGTERALEKLIGSGVYKVDGDSDTKSRLKKLYSGRIDAAVFNPGASSVKFTAKKAGLNVSDFSVIDPPVAVSGKHIGIIKTMGKADLIKKINAAIDKLTADGTLAAIKAKY